MAAVVVVFALGLGAVRAQAASDTREIKAREDFAAGRFQEALDIFARLYAESLHPIYLRNIGRCYQGMRNPDRAIDDVPRLPAQGEGDLEGREEGDRGLHQ